MPSIASPRGPMVPDGVEYYERQAFLLVVLALRSRVPLEGL